MKHNSITIIYNYAPANIHKNNILSASYVFLILTFDHNLGSSYI